MPIAAIPVTRIYAGLDLGQVADHSALSVIVRTSVLSVERDVVTQARVDRRTYDLRFVERWPLRTSYPAVVARCEQIFERLAIQFPNVDMELAYDATGVGKAVGDLLQRARWPVPLGIVSDSPGSRLRLTGISITGGDRASERDGKVYVPKRDLIAALVVLFQSGRLRIASSLPHREVLLNELLNFRGRMAASGHETFSNAGGVNGAANDDLVSACAFAAYRATLGGGGPQLGPLIGCWPL